MRLLFDNNLSPNLVKKLRRQFPGSAHVFTLNIHTLSDEDLWEYARSNGFVVVTKDFDFVELQFLRGYPPKIVWLTMGNASTIRILEILRQNTKNIRIFGRNQHSGCLVINQ